MTSLGRSVAWRTASVNSVKVRKVDLLSMGPFRERKINDSLVLLSTSRNGPQHFRKIIASPSPVRCLGAPSGCCQLALSQGGGVLLLGHPAPVPKPGLLGASHLLGVRGGQAGLFLCWTEKSRKWEKFILAVISGKVKLFLGRKQSVFICVCGSVVRVQVTLSPIPEYRYLLEEGRSRLSKDRPD